MLKMMDEQKSPILEPEDISEAVIYVLGTPPRVQVRDSFYRLLVISHETSSFLENRCMS
jgi:NADP-dependent 3-hydroxy acid dehydrogenase YdfG